MAEIIRMPRMSDTMTEGVLVAWHKQIGDTVNAGDLLAEIETDKATMDMESYQEGVLLYQGVEPGKSVAVDGVLAIVGEKGEDYKELLASAEAEAAAAPAEEETPAVAPAPAPAPSPSPAPAPAPAAAPVVAAVAAPPATGNGRLKASPLARKMAQDRGIDLTAIAGSGEGGRIVKRDIETFVPSAAPAGAPATAAQQVVLPQVVGQESYEEVATSQMRKTIARRLAESKFTAPHFYLTMEVAMDSAWEARQRINEYADVKISFNDMVVKAAAGALRRHPEVNASWMEDRIRYNHHVHVGVAVAVDEGLLVPVIRFADNKSLSHISAETRELAGKARDRKLQPNDWEGNTFTISNLGMFGIEEFTAIINPPDSVILAVGSIREVPVVEDGHITIGRRMKVTLSCDHRVVDGAVGSKFLNTLKELLEEPVRLLA